MRNATAALCLPVSLAMLIASCGRPADRASVPNLPIPRASIPAQQLSETQPAPAAGPVNPDPRIGAIFPDGDDAHFCTASVLHSADGDLVLTAAHCLLGQSKVTFVPGFAGAAGPSDHWSIRQIYFDPRWINSADPHADYAIARVIGTGSESLERQVGSALSLGAAPVLGSLVTVTGYPAGVGGRPVACQGSTGRTDSGFPSLSCDGLVGGTSGAPWVRGSTVTGVIGGLESGGCTESMSYSAPFDEHTAALLVRAEAGGPGDTAPVDLADTC
ncbi:trypsin-like serine peptidase [Mycobacterium angelicum]|uniref:Trypsin n=1 Tax=Mycobacterium angelicum TaxID=470074 RepID=A0A1W9ZSQ0_MYCAN|nr:trypsin-like peptidase domain-containing protein [Mycobacterium angelicum]MCV7196962.1 trypsin-like peptidase domain-containing protein [Mycobacterium angelicum]ORA20819.1 trypsin [Mycobacterium angelicum]